MARTGYVEIPESWARLEARAFGPFVTHEVFRRPDGSTVTWDSRAHRKRLGPETSRGSTWWAPTASAWWIGLLFMVGSICFALGSLPGYVDAVGIAADGITFFVGSIFFTSAGLLQYLEVANVSRTTPRAGGRQRFRLLAWEPGRIDWWATSIQLGGTLLFNVSTFHALQGDLNAAQANRLVWRPDALGSSCFLVASGLAWAEVGHGWISWRPRDLSWQIALLNLGGSLAFGVSALASKIVPASGEPRNAELVNLGTFVGALAFLVGAFLLLPERTSAPDDGASPVRDATITQVGRFSGPSRPAG